MKVTSLKDMESYIYSAVILPLKALDIDPLGFTSPITDKHGGQWRLVVLREEVDTHGLQHNYQRDLARENAHWLVRLEGNGFSSIIVAEYEARRHSVRVYRGSIAHLEDQNGAKLLINKLDEAFRRHTPFNKVALVDGVRDEGIAVAGSMRLDRIPF